MIDYFLLKVNVFEENFLKGGVKMYEKIVELCSKKGITVTSLERELNFGRSTIQKWKKSSPTVDKLVKVANYFNVSIDYFFNDNIKPVQ